MNPAIGTADNRRMKLVQRAPFAGWVWSLALLCATTSSARAAHSPAPAVAGDATSPRAAAAHEASPWPALRVPIAEASVTPANESAVATTGAWGAGCPLERERGWKVAGFPLGQTSYGVYLQIAGRSEIGRVEVLYADGTLERIEPVPGHVYGSGIYELARFGESRRVALVRMQARAASRQARVNVLLAPQPF